MKKTIGASLAIATIAGSLVSFTPPANAHGGLGVGLAAGLLGGAIVGGAIAASRPAYGGPVYVEEGPPPPPYRCHVRHRRYWDGYEWVIRPVRICD
jgi:hypothetical protein